MTTLRHATVPALLALAFGALLTACNADRNANIPANAMLGSSGNNHLEYTAPSDGMVWIYDTGSDRIDYSGKVNKGDAVVVDPGNNRITVNGNTVMDKGLNTLNTHQIFFQQGPSTTHVYERETTVTREPAQQ